MIAESVIAINQRNVNMKFEKVLITIAFVLVLFQSESSCDDDVTCKIQLNQRSSSSSSLSSSSSSSSSSSLMITAFSGQNVPVNKFQSACINKNSESVYSEVSGYEENGFLCITFACYCDGSSFPPKMATCHEVTSQVMTSFCRCCSQEKALCVWKDEHVINTTIAKVSPHPTVWQSRDEGNHANIDGIESGEPPDPYYMVIFFSVGFVIIGSAMVFFVVYKLRCSSGVNDDGRYFAIAHIYSAYAKLQHNSRCATGRMKCKTPPLLSHCPASRTRSLSDYNGGSLGKDPIEEVDEDNIDP